jgi:hypothetical protein
MEVRRMDAKGGNGRGFLGPFQRFSHIVNMVILSLSGITPIELTLGSFGHFNAFPLELTWCSWYLSGVTPIELTWGSLGHFNAFP